MREAKISILSLYKCLFLILVLCGCTREKGEINIIVREEGSRVTEYAVEEIFEIMGSDYVICRSDSIVENGVNIVLKTDSCMEPYSFSVNQITDERGKIIFLTGYDETALLHSVYTMFENSGITFQITGMHKPENLDFNTLEDYSEVIKPVVQRRGIRQHINFAMDISSYPVDEACNYIRNLARMRMNYITFHSYPGQWYSYSDDGKEVMAGNFFYGQKHYLPRDKDLRKLIRNDSIFCIPSIESSLNNPGKRSQMAVEWLNRVMDEAKKVGLTVNMSCELRKPGIEFALETFSTINKNYPLIDGLEFITEEDFSCLEQVNNNVSCSVDLLKQATDRGIQLTTGIYNTSPDELKEGFVLLRNTTPEEIHLSVLPSHGARVAVRNLSGIPLLENDLRRTMIYSWIEFDGLMYLQQNPVEGIRMMIDENLKLTGNKPLYGICWNHWRTYENRTAFSYAAKAMIEGPVPAKDFYYYQARNLEIGEPDIYVKAMARLDETDDFCRNKLFNIGFCFGGYWKNKPGLSLYGRFSKENLQTAINGFNSVNRDLLKCIDKTVNVSGQYDLEFMINRINCTILHLKAFLVMTELQPLFKKSSEPVLSESDRELVVEKCSEALAYEEQYLELHAQYMPDRGCEGTLVSYMAASPQLLLDIIAKYGGKETGTKQWEDTFDEPPEPLLVN